MPIDESACFELECCPPGVSVPPVAGSSPLLVEALNAGPYPSVLDSLTEVQAENFQSLVT